MIDVISGSPPQRRCRTAALALAALLGLGASVEASQAASLRYFGYFAARITAAGGDHLPEVAGRSNLNWIQISDPDRYAPEVLDHCAPAGCIISTGHEFFRGCDAVHSPDCELYPDYAARWSRLAEVVRSRIDRVGAFYLMDEPQWRGATPAELETAARTIKATYPTIPVMMVEAGPQISSSYQVPASVDWVGFDWYCRPFSDVESKLATLTSRVASHQPLFLLPEAAPLEECGGAAGHATDAEIARLQYSYYNLALSNPKVIGLLAFGFWTSGFGSAQLPLTVAAHEDLFRRIAPPPTPPAPAPAPPDHPVRFLGEVARIDRQGRVGVRLRSPAANAASCAGSLSLRRVGKASAGPKRPPLGKRRFAVAPGRAKTVSVMVEQGRGRLLRLARGRRGVRLKAIAVTATGKAVGRFRVRPAAAKPERAAKPDTRLGER